MEKHIQLVQASMRDQFTLRFLERAFAKVQFKEDNGQIKFQHFL